jgi:uncharacterized protein YbjT (DUF2867 family)
MIAVDDIGAFATLAFEHPGKWQGRAIDIAGADLSMSELASAFSRISGREVRYHQVRWDEFEKQAGPEITTMYKWFQDVGYSVDLGAVRREYPQLTSFDRWIEANWRTAAKAAG